ncbi:MAG: D-alanyl-D-alanine carboxypeptidase/D-alanyl-D-alanine-endopeptidase [Gemmatimonadota bacterium]|nr:D-alanyl-D-alanine carboxypeptidase/D-alanyl-D-alanine-endopeptidase [Gemmatimonadota bacterium]
MNGRIFARVAFALGVAWLGAAPLAAQGPGPGGGTATATPEGIAERLDPVVRGHRGTVGVAVYSVDRNLPLYLHEADESMLPASNMKLYTTAAALDRLGPHFQFTTSLYADGPLLPDGTLAGNLILAGRGDPTLSGRFFSDSVPYVFDVFAGELAEAGVRRVTGRLIGDASYFDDRLVAPGWEEGNLLWWYGARVSALSFNDNVVTIEVTPGDWVGARARVAFVPPGKRLNVVNRIRTVSRRGGRAIGVERRPDLAGYEIWGRIPISSRPLRYVVAVDRPASYALSVLRHRLSRAGISVVGRDQVVHDREFLPDRPRRLVASHVSPPLIELVRVVNKRSQNFFAEQLLKALGAVVRGEGSFVAGRRVVEAFVREELGVMAEGLRVADGSGLSRLDRTTARTTAEMLVAMRDHPWFDEWYDSLLIAGIDGDPRRLDDPDAVDNVRSKTGTLRGVSALSGYVTTRDGELLAFSVMTNGLPRGKSASIAIEDAVAERLASYSAWHPPLLQKDRGR